jgi:Enoyl-CoA hydratase/isomerase
VVSLRENVRSGDDLLRVHAAERMKATTYRPETALEKRSGRREIVDGSISMEQHLFEAIAEGVATLTFNRPDRLNALSTPMMEGLLEALPRLARDAAVGAIVLTGAAF